MCKAFSVSHSVYQSFCSIFPYESVFIYLSKIQYLVSLISSVPLYIVPSCWCKRINDVLVTSCWLKLVSVLTLLGLSDLGAVGITWWGLLKYRWSAQQLEAWETAKICLVMRSTDHYLPSADFALPFTFHLHLSVLYESQSAVLSDCRFQSPLSLSLTAIQDTFPNFSGSSVINLQGYDKQGGR